MDEGEPILRSDVAGLEQIVPELPRQFDGTFTEADIYQLLSETYVNLRQNATVYEYLVTCPRLTRDRLAEAARSARTVSQATLICHPDPGRCRVVCLPFRDCPQDHPGRDSSSLARGSGSWPLRYCLRRW